jgi:PD-(D/E)XK nuclease superfamily protein
MRPRATSLSKWCYLRLKGEVMNAQRGPELAGDRQEAKHIVAAIAIKGDQKVLVSLKWQQVGGTAEQKIPYEVVCMLKALKNNQGTYSKAYVVLGGEGWTMRNFYVEGGLDEYLQGTENIKIVTFENFIFLANKGIL